MKLASNTLKNNTLPPHHQKQEYLPHSPWTYKQTDKVSYGIADSRLKRKCKIEDTKNNDSFDF